MSGSSQGSPLQLAVARLRHSLSSKRSALGLMAALMIIGAASIWFAGVVAASFASIAGPLLRAGLVLGAVWLAWPQLARVIRQVPHWLAVGLVVVLFVGILRPWFLFVVLPAVLLLWFLGPVLARKFQPPAKPQARTRPVAKKAASKKT